MVNEIYNKLPQEYLTRMRAELGENFDDYLKALATPSVRGVRVNSKRFNVEKFVEIFGENVQKIDYEKNGFIFKSDQKVGNDILHQAGMIYMQEPSSMIPVASAELEKENRPLKILDLCASPGGKTGQIVCKTNDESIIVSNEIIKARADVLYSNVERQGFKNVIITNETPEDLLVFEGYFDYVFVDAPCSGEGMFRKNPETISEWSVENVKMCAERQREILEVAEKLVCAGGKLVYSTCTFSKEEDEEIVDWFLENFNYKLKKTSDEVLKKTIPSNSKAKNGAFARKFYPFFAEGEGQFVAIFENLDDERTTKMHTKKHFGSIEKIGKSEWSLYEEFIKTSLKAKPQGNVFRVGDNLFLTQPEFDSTLQTALDRLKFNTLGVKIGTVQKGRLEPNHSIFIALQDDFLKSHEVDDTNLKKYLHGEELFTNLTGKGYVVITHEGFAVGGAKLVNGRLKNLYPKGLRI